MRKILVTGFEPFATSALNPSGEIVKTLRAPDVVSVVLPVIFEGATRRVIDLIQNHKPQTVLCLGQTEGQNEEKRDSGINFIERLDLCLQRSFYGIQHYLKGSDVRS